MNILEYIDDLMDQGYLEEDAMICADCMFSDIIEYDDDAYDPDPDDYYEADLTDYYRYDADPVDYYGD